MKKLLMTKSSLPVKKFGMPVRYLNVIYFTLATFLEHYIFIVIPNEKETVLNYLYLII